MKKKLLTVLLAFCMLPMLMGAGVSATEDELSVSAVVDGVEVSTVETAGETYLFLPSNADVTELTLRFELNGETTTVTLSGDNGSVEAAETFNLHDLASKDSMGRYVIFAEVGDMRELVYLMQGESLPTMHLWSDSAEKGREWVDSSKDNKAKGSMLLVNAKGSSIYDGGLSEIKARGNSTFREYPKKAYQIKLESKTDLLGTGEKVKTWVLLANYGDSTLIHDKFFKDLAACMGMDYTTACNWVNLYYDGEYRGVYLLTEKVSVGGDAVDITDMEDAYEELNPSYGDSVQTAQGTNAYGQKYQYTVGLTEPEDLTGGWLIEKNMNYLDEASGFFTSHNVAFNVKSPKYAGEEAMEYISEYYQEFENAVYATDEDGNYTGYNAETGKYYYEYCDLESLVQVFLIQELGLNPDGFHSSMFFRKDAGEIMYAGPIWDWDMSLGTGWTKRIPETVQDYHYIASPLIKIPHFREAVEEYYTVNFAPLVRNQLASGATIDQFIAKLTPNAAMNYQLWPYVRIGSPSVEGHLWAEGTNYQVVTNDMKTWLNARLAVLDKRFKSEAEQLFDDVAVTDWEYEAVRYAVKNGLFAGVGNNLFAPDISSTRAMTWTVLMHMAGVNATPAEGESWIQPGLDWVLANGISDGTMPNEPITREQLATMLYHYAGNPEGKGNLAVFSDADEISSWALEAMEWAVAEGIYCGDGTGTINPRGVATRAQLAQVIMNYLIK